MNTYLIMLLLFSMTVLGSIGALFFKIAINKMKKVDIINFIKTKEIYFGGFFYLSSLAINMVALKFADYSVVYPSTALSYVWTLFISYIVFKEKVDIYKVLAVASILIGIICVNL